MRFRELVHHANPDLDLIPSGYKRYGHVMVLRSSHQLSHDLGKTILQLYSWCTSVYQHHTTTGQSRIPTLQLLAGEDNPIVIHKENGVEYKIDLSRITFSGGNRRLRQRLVDQITDDEFLLDMFAAVGNLSLQPLVHREIEALLIERNPYTYSFLQTNLELNNLSTSIAVNTDCRALPLDRIADRIYMGYHEVDRSHLEVAIKAAKKQCFIHLHPIVPVGDIDPLSLPYSSIFESQNIGFDVFAVHPVKDYSPGLQHIEVIYLISK